MVNEKADLIEYDLTVIREGFNNKKNGKFGPLAETFLTPPPPL